MDHINETYINTSAKPILRWFFLSSIPAKKGKAANHPSSPRAWSATALFATLSTLVKKFHFHSASPHSSIQPGQETWREITNLQAKSDLGDPMSSHAQIETHFEIEYHRSNLGSVKTYRNLHTIPMYTPHIHTCKHHLFIKCSLNFGGGCHSHVQRLSQVTTMSTRTAIASFLRQLFAPWFPLWRPKIILRYVLMNQHCLRSALATSTSQYKTSTAN